MVLQIIGLGATQEVGRSSFFFHDRDQNILIDAGLKLFPKRTNIPPLPPVIPLEDRENFFTSLNAILVSHAHLDHIGYIPAAYHYGYRGKIYMTEPTAQLAKISWADTLKIEGNRFYTEEDVQNTLNNIVTTTYCNKIKISDQIKVIFYDAGHILGSSSIELDWDGQKLLYTGDFTDEPSLLHTGHHIPITDEPYDLVLSEATNHHDGHPIPRNASNKNLVQSALEVYNHRGKMLIPAFSIGRSQEILSILMTYLDDLLFSFPIYIAGAIVKVNEIYKEFFKSPWINPDLIKSVKDQDNTFLTPWDHPAIETAQDYYTQKAIMKDDEPKIIVSTHGMVETGPIHNILSFGHNKPNNLLAFVGHQSPGSIGYDILNNVNPIELGYGKYKRNYDLKLQIAKFGFSGHISRRNLEHFLQKLPSKKILTVHGDHDSMINLQTNLTKEGISADVLPSLQPILLAKVVS